MSHQRTDVHGITRSYDCEEGNNHDEHASRSNQNRSENDENHRWRALPTSLGAGVGLRPPLAPSGSEKETSGRVLSVSVREKLAAIADERLWPNTCPDPNSGCILWAGRVNESGYGNVGAAILGLKNIPVHRLAWVLKHGVLPPSDICVCHKCDTRRCVNEWHLFLGTRGDNSRDMAKKGRSAVGRRQHLAKLSDDIVRAIRASNGTDVELAAEYGVAPQTINQIVRRQTWRHVI